MRRAIRTYGSSMLAIVFIAIVATVVGGYILLQQRFKPPLTERYTVKAEFPTSTALTPGLGQPVNVAGVKVGQIADIELVNGRAVVSLEIDPGELPSVRRDASATLVPRTALKDMQVELFPGKRSAPELDEGGVIPVSRTSSPTDSDELTGALDADTREFLQILVAEGARGTAGRGEDLRRLLKALGPTTQQVEDLGDELVGRRRELRRLVHSLSVLAEEAGGKDAELARIVSSGSATFGALAEEEASLRRAVRDLPGTMRAARGSLEELVDFSAEVRPALQALRPANRDLPAAVAALGPLAREATPIVRTQLRPLAREIQPLADSLRPAVRNLSAVTPNLTSAFQVLNYLANELGYNAPGDDEGFLFWTAWFVHNGASFLSTQDANGGAWRGLLTVSCDTLTASPAVGALLGTILGGLPTC